MKDIKQLKAKLKALIDDEDVSLRGAQGVPGTNGLNGKDGRDGVDGINGKDGKDGVDGTAFTKQMWDLNRLEEPIYTNENNLSMQGKAITDVATPTDADTKQVANVEFVDSEIQAKAVGAIGEMWKKGLFGVVTYQGTSYLDLNNQEIHGLPPQKVTDSAFATKPATMEYAKGMSERVFGSTLNGGDYKIANDLIMNNQVIRSLKDPDEKSVFGYSSAVTVKWFRDNSMWNPNSSGNAMQAKLEKATMGVNLVIDGTSGSEKISGIKTALITSETDVANKGYVDSKITTLMTQLFPEKAEQIATLMGVKDERED